MIRVPSLDTVSLNNGAIKTRGQDHRRFGLISILSSFHKFNFTNCSVSLVTGTQN